MSQVVSSSLHSLNPLHPRVSSMYKEYSDDQLYTQLSYLDYLLDCQKMKQV